MKDFWKYLLATVCGILIAGCLCSLLSFAVLGALMSLGESETSLTEHSVYRIDLDGTLAERATDDDYSAAFMELAGRKADQQIGLDDLLRNIRIAKENEKIDGIYLRGGQLGMGFASAQELRRALLDFKESGKFIVAYADQYGQGNYWLATVADKMYLNAHGTVNWSGLSTTLMFYARALDKLGVEMQVVKVGTFKSAVEPYILTGMSEPNRLQMNTLLQDIWGVVTTDVAASRNLSVEELNRLADLNMTYQPEEDLVKSGLVDSLIYMQDMKQILTNLTGTEDYNLVSHSDMNNLPSSEKFQKDKIAVVYAEGEITDDSGSGIVGTDMVKTINKIAEKDNVKAVVLRVNSPGGSANASEQIWHALALLKEKKPLIVSMGDYAASGGYYISCIADSILAEENTLTGSIGIFGLIPSVGKIANKIGLDFDGVQTNRMSRMESNMKFKGMNKEERALMQGMVNRGYELFVSRCADGRSKTTDEIKSIAEGRVWSGQRALDLGLVDKIGNTDDAIAIAAEKAGLTEYQIVSYPEKKDKMTQLIESLAGGDEEEMLLLKEYSRIRKMTEKPSVQARLPYEIEIR